MLNCGRMIDFFSLFQPGDCFVGYHSDSVAAIVIQIFNFGNDWSDEQVRSFTTFRITYTLDYKIMRLKVFSLEEQLFFIYLSECEDLILQEYSILAGISDGIFNLPD